MFLTTSMFLSPRRSLFALVALAFLAGTPALATWTHLQDVSWPNGEEGCAIGTTQCTLGPFSNPTTAGSTLALGFGLHQIAGQGQGQIQIVSAYTCNIPSPPTSTTCDPANGNVIDTFTFPENHECGDSDGVHFVDCAYVVAGAGGATFLTINITSGGNHWFPSMTEALSDTGTQTFDAAGAAKSSEDSLTHPGVTFNLIGTNDFIFQIIDAGSDESEITPFPTICSGQTYVGLFDDHYASAYALNTSCGMAPIWTCTYSNDCPDTGVVGAVAFKE